MGRYPLEITFYEGIESLKWHKIFKMFFQCERYYHIGIGSGDYEIFVTPHRKPIMFKKKRLHKIWKPHLIIQLKDIEVTPDNLNDYIPENFFPHHPIITCVCCVLESTFICPWRPDSCSTLVCIVLNKLGINIPLTSSPRKIRRWLDENNCIYRQSYSR